MAGTREIARRNGLKGGRPKGSRTKATVDVKVAAQVYTRDALRVLVKIMNDDKAAHAARVAAANAILDRGHGRPTQAVSVDMPMVPLFALGVMPSVSQEDRG